MKLSQTEAKLVRRLRDSEKMWRWARWLLLAMGGLWFAVALWILSRLFRAYSSDGIISSIDLLFCMLLAPAAWLMLCIGGLSVVYAVAFWPGKPVTRLLLRLIDECAKEE